MKSTLETLNEAGVKSISRDNLSAFKYCPRQFYTQIKPTEHEVYAEIEFILADKKAYSKSLNYAVEYCRAAQGCREKLFVFSAFIFSVIYLLGDIQMLKESGRL